MKRGLKFGVFLVVFGIFLSLGIASAACPTKTLTIYSDDADTGLVPSAGETLIEVSNAAWFNKNLVGGGAEWIWETVYNPQVNESLNLTKTFNIPGNVQTANFIFGIDNFLTLYVNGIKVLDHVPSGGLCSDTPLPTGVACCFCIRPHTIDISTFLTSGDNEIVFETIGEGIPGSGAAANPAGLIYKIDIGYCEEPPTCPDNDRIMKLFSSTNSHGALWDYNGGNKIFYRCYNPSTGDHMTSAYSDCEVSLGTGVGYINEGILGYAFVSQIPGTVPLYRCYNSIIVDHVNVLSSDCEGSAGYVLDLGTPMGYGYPSQELNTYQFNRCYNPSTGDHLDPWYPYDSCPSGYNLENLNFYIFNRMGYVYDICYSDIFGVVYTGANPHACTGTGAIPDNKVLGLYSVNNSHAEIPNLDSYPIDVCYGDLSCMGVADPASCPTNYNYKTVVRLYQDSNSHISNASYTNYGIKICCLNGSIAAGGLTDAFWASMNSSEVITQADLNDRVRLMVQGTELAGKTINYTIYKTVRWWFDRKIAEDSTVGFITWVANKTGGYWFRAEIEGGDIEDSQELEVSDSEDNTPPTTEILSPEICEIYFTGENVSFTQNSSDEDDDIAINWNFGDGSTSVEYNVNHSYISSGQKTIVLTVTDERGLTASDRTTILVVDASKIAPEKYICAYINTPEWGDNIYGFDIFFNATETYAINASDCDGTKCNSIECIAGPCKTQTAGGGGIPVTGTIPNWIGFANINFSWSFDDNVIYTAKGMSGAWFNKIFGTIGSHWAKLTASINPSGSTETEFSNYLENKCGIDFSSGVGKWVWWDSNGVVQDPLKEQGACLDTDGTPNPPSCCPPGYACINSTADPLSSLCQISGSDYCASIVVCDDYVSQAECQNDICKKGRLQPAGTCGGTIFGGIEFCGSDYFSSKSSECVCLWNETAEEGHKCHLKENLWSTIYQGTPIVYRCEAVTEHGECIDSLMNIQVIKDLIFESGILPPPSQAEVEECEAKICQDYEGTIMCGRPLIALTFFTLISLIIAIVVIIIIYVIWIKKRSKGKIKARKKKKL